MKKAVTAVVAVGLMFGLAGCSPEGGESQQAAEQGGTVSGEGLHERAIKLQDGRTIVCVVYREYRKGGLSCDWAGTAR